MPKSKIRSQLKNDQWVASRNFDFAAPGSGEELMAKIAFKQATKMLAKMDVERKKRDKAVNKKK